MTDIGDKLTPQLTVDPFDATTTATLTVTNPAGSSSDHVVATTDGGHTWRGTTSVVFDAARWWILTWTVTGTGASRQLFRVFVRPDWAYGGQDWTPTREQVAAYVPARTVAVATLSDTQLGTFDATTRPTGDQVDEIIVGAVAWVMMRTGPIVTGTPMAPILADNATTVAAIRAAGMVELAYPVRDADINTSETLLAQAETMLVTLDAANRADGGTDPDTPALLPQWSFPTPVTWGDALYL